MNPFSRTVVKDAGRDPWSKNITGLSPFKKLEGLFLFALDGLRSTIGLNWNDVKEKIESGDDSQEITKNLAALTDWRGATLRQVRELIRQADPEVLEELKWRKPSNNMEGIPVWSHSGIICTGEIYKDKVKLTFAKGASLPDPKGLFNSSLEGNTRRAIDLFEGREIDGAAFTELFKSAVALNKK